MLTEEFGGTRKPFQGIPHAQRVRRSDPTSITRKDVAFDLGVEEMRQSTKSGFGKGQRDAFLMLNSQIPQVRGSDEVHGELNPSSASLELARLLGPRELRPVPFEGFENLEADSRLRKTLATRGAMALSLTKFATGFTQ